MTQKIPDFMIWCGSHELELPFPPEKEPTANENIKRTGGKEGLYPPAYYASQYPPLWKIPGAADSFYYQSISKK